MEPATSHGSDSLRFGPYVAVRHIANGGMAEIYLAHDSRRTHAGSSPLFVVKRLHPHLADQRSFLNMFVDEARIASLLDHRNIVRVYDTGAVADSYFFAMEFLHGHSLAAVCRRLASSGQQIRLEHALGIVVQLCAALAYAHDLRDERGNPMAIVHRDISPSNVHITFDGTVKLLDFGIARARNRIEKTRVGVLKGKLRYMSPEQALAGEVDRRSDIYALSTLLWELSTNRRYFDQMSDFAVLRSLGSGAVRPPSSVCPDYPDALEEIVLRGLQRDPADRYQSAGELGLALAKFARGSGLDVTAQGLSRVMEGLFDRETAPTGDAPNGSDQCVTRLTVEAEDDYSEISIELDDDDVIEEDHEVTALGGAWSALLLLMAVALVAMLAWRWQVGEL